MFGTAHNRGAERSESGTRPSSNGHRNGHHANGNGDGNGHAVKTLPRPARLNEDLPVVSANGNAFPIAEKLPEHRRRFYIPLKLKLLFVALCSLGWVGFSLWLAIPWIQDLGQSITVPVAAALIAGIAII